MRYLLTWKVLRVPLEAAKMAITLLNASDEYTEKLVKEGVIKEVWANADGSGGGCIGEVDSNEQGYKLMMANPYTPFLEYELVPIIDFKLASDTSKSILEKFA